MICSNLLEHLTDPRSFAAACGDLVVPGGHGVFTVPYSYPYHPDPIDTMLRPTPQELATMLPGWAVEREKVLTSGSYIDDLRSTGRPWSTLFKQVGRAALPFYRRKHWHHVSHRLLWLTKRYKLSMVQLRKPA